MTVEVPPEVGTLADSDAAMVAGAVVVGLGIIVAVSAPHEWMKWC